MEMEVEVEARARESYSVVYFSSHTALHITAQHCTAHSV